MIHFDVNEYDEFAPSFFSFDQLRRHVATTYCMISQTFVLLHPARSKQSTRCVALSLSLSLTECINIDLRLRHISFSIICVRNESHFTFFVFFLAIEKPKSQILIMLKLLLLTIVCVALVRANVKDDLQDKAKEALNQGEKLKVSKRKCR